jgi:7-cyano-7-deazaguanine synthase
MIDLGTKPETHISIVTPVIDLKKSEIIKRGMELHAPFELTWSCYKTEDKACGVCESCALRLRAFQMVGLEDPIPYAQRPTYV